jgi:prepilin-type N-terminal cleavage/methylation domain-containing protein
MVRRGKKGSRGFTLVELGVTIAVSSVALVATAGAVTRGAQLAQTAAETRAALRSCQSLMERVRSTSYSTLSATYNNQTFTMASLGCGNSNGSCAVTVTSVPTGSAQWTAYQVTVTATWTGAAGASSQTMTTYVCDRKNGGVN